MHYMLLAKIRYLSDTPQPTCCVILFFAMTKPYGTVCCHHPEWFTNIYFCWYWYCMHCSRNRLFLNRELHWLSGCARVVANASCFHWFTALLKQGGLLRVGTRRVVKKEKERNQRNERKSLEQVERHGSDRAASNICGVGVSTKLY